MPRENKTRYAILGALSVKPMSGYDIINWLSKVTKSFWSESEGQVYPTLERLQKLGLIKSEKASSSGKRLRKVYALTKQGTKELDLWLRKPAQKTLLRSEFILKLFYGKRLTKKECISHLELREKEIHDELLYFKNIEDHIESDHKKLSDSFYWLITVNHAKAHLQSELKWCWETQKIINNSKNKK
jgi:PadR family transcriptional regulator, regulatory protein AphA